MITLDIDPQAEIPAPRPMPDEVVLLTCDANGARSWVKITKDAFDQITGMGWREILDDGISRLHERGGPPDDDWALDPAVLAARDEAKAKYLADPANIRPGDSVQYRDPRQQPGVPRSDDVI